MTEQQTIPPAEPRRTFLRHFVDGGLIDRPVIGMIHLRALPGTPGFAPKSSLSEVLDAALIDLEALVAGGIDAVIIENYGDIPFHPHAVEPHTVAAMTRIALEVRRNCRLPIGVNVLRNDPLAALSIAHAAEASMIRVNVHSGAMLTDQGIVQGEARRTLDLRRSLQSDVAIMADVHVKHARPLVPIPIEESAADCIERGMADALIVTGSRTGGTVDFDELQRVRAAVTAPVLVGSGVTIETIAEILQSADAVIVGSWLKEAGEIGRNVDPARVAKLMERVREGGA